MYPDLGLVLLMSLLSKILFTVTEDSLNITNNWTFLKVKCYRSSTQYRRKLNQKTLTRVTRQLQSVEQEQLIPPEYLIEFTPVYNEVRVAQSLVFCIMFCRSLFVLLSFFFWLLYGLSFFDYFLSQALHILTHIKSFPMTPDIKRRNDID